MRNRQVRHEQGDTIVEVLIAIAILGVVLAIAFSTMNRNIAVMRTNQERTEAAKIAQGQLESLKILSGANPTALGSQAGNPFCLVGTTIQPQSSGVPAADAESDDFSLYNASCRNNFYNFVVRRDAADATNRTYEVMVRWDAISTETRQEVRMYYKVTSP